ncbi:hypothetical protein ACNQFZ_19895 [Schinkia sp. CFF1]
MKNGNERMNNNHPYRYVFRSHIDSISILTVKAVLELRQFDHLDTLESQLVVEAIKRSTNELSTDASLEEVSEYVQTIPEEGIDGFVNNIQGIYHELYAADIENNDGDEWVIEVHEDTNAVGSDAILRNLSTGEEIEIQYKATDNPALVSTHYDKNPDIQVYGPDELAATDERVIGDGTSYPQLREDTIETIDTIRKSDQTFDGMGPLTVVLTLLEAKPVIQQYIKKEITFQEAVKKLTLITGLKAAKIGAILLLLSNPITGVPTSGILLGKLAIELHKVNKSIS